jgi:RsiW-degrading membrane proteinase PrsW (M82 family)
VPNLLSLATSILAAGFAWATYFYFKDVYEPEPRRLLLTVFGAGMAAVGPAYLLYRLAERFGLGVELALDDDAAVRLAFCVLVVGTIEELCKFLPVLVLIGHHSDFDEPLDGIVYAAFGALGFASMENFVIGRWLEGPELWGRLLASPLTHALFAAVWGWSLSLDRFARPRRPGRVALGLLLAILVHGLYDFLVLSPWPGRLFGAGLVLLLWIVFFRVVSHALKTSPHRPPA